MNNKKKTALVPKLRFPEFNDYPEWATRKFGDLIYPVEERAGSKKYTLMSVNAGQGLVTQIEKFGREIAGSAYKNYYVIKKGDFAYNKSATKQFPEGYISMLTEYEEAALPNSVFTCFRITDKDTYPKIFDHLFHANYHGTWLRQYIEVGGRAHGSLSVNINDLWAMPVALPKLEEQQKIADCLSSLDELITAEDKKLNALKTHKKGLMQKLFPAEGKTVPELRFPEFRNSGNYPDWATVRLDDIGKLGSGGIDKKYNSEDQEVYMVNFMDVYTKKCISKQTYKALMKTTAPKEKLVKSLLKKHDMLFLLASETSDDIGHSIVIEDDFDDLVHSYHTALFRPNIELDLKFQKYFCNTVNILRQFSKISKGQIRVFITKDDFNGVLVSLSCLEEQKKIADCLSSLDDLITAQAKKIAELKLHKKSLMQGLFPSFEEIKI